ncbi:MAG: phosphoribosylglycinamide formyltransferase [Candidatus Krumholzibacteriia bacterium]
MTEVRGDENPVRLAVLLSGSGRTLENFLACIDAGDLPVRVVAVVASRPDVRGLAVAGAAGIPAAVFRRRDHATVADHNAAINAWLEQHDPEIIALAGYLSFYIPPEGFRGPVVNIHPALLPKFGGQGYYGDRVHEAVLAAGDTESGCTVHHVDLQYDHGAVIAQQRVPVLPGDDVHSLADRVFAAECELYPRVLRRLAEQVQSRRP